MALLPPPCPLKCPFICCACHQDLQLGQVHYLFCTCLQVRKRALWEAKRDLNYGLNGQVATSSDGRETSEARRMTQADTNVIHGTQQQVTRC